MNRCLLLMLLGACGRIGFDGGTTIDGGNAGDARDAPGDGSASFGPWRTPTEVDSMESKSMDFGPTFSPDANEVYIAQRFTGDADIYRFTRANAASPFGAGVAMTALNISMLGFEEGEPSLSDDGLTIYFNRYAPDRIFSSSRSSVTAIDWTPPALVTGIDGYHSVDFAGDLRRVLTSSSFIWESTRSSTAMPWGDPVSLGIVGNVPCLRRDGLELLWEGAVTIAGDPSYAIFRATRPTVDDAFGPPERLSFGALDVAGVGDPELSHDGRTLIFSAEEVPGNETYDIYITERDIE